MKDARRFCNEETDGRHGGYFTDNVRNALSLWDMGPCLDIGWTPGEDSGFLKRQTY